MEEHYLPSEDLACMRSFLKLVLLAAGCSICLFGQGNYEIQVYGSDTVPPGRTMVELHSNLTVSGFRSTVAGVLPDQHQGNATGVALSNAYYPEGRNATDALVRLGTQLGFDMGSNILKEFSPDINRHFSRMHRSKNP